jgi:uncharacterized protein (TIGR02996 family)
MPDLRAAFFEAIRADPGDDVARLVFADWLDEHGEPGRAEFIRLQIALARGTVPRAEVEAIEKRADELLFRHREEWLPGCEGVDWMVGFRRGFGDVVVIPPGEGEAFAQKAARLFALAPILEISLDPNPSFWPTFAAIPELQRIRRLRVAHLSSDSLAVLVASPHLSGLRELDLNGSRIGVEGVAVLLESSLLNHVTSLALGGLRDIQNYDWDETDWTDYTVENVGEEGVLALSASAKMAGVRRLDLSWNRLGAQAADALVRSAHLRRVEELKVAERGSVAHDWIDQSQREFASPLTAAAIGTLRDRFGGALRVWPDR